MEEQPTRRKGAGWMLHMAEMAVVQDVHTRQPAEMQAQAEALARAEAMQRGLLLFNIEEMQTRFDKNLAKLEENLFERKMLGSLVSCL
jgi:ABC-type sulfate/molybdate transport systems ATPase subunit